MEQKRILITGYAKLPHGITAKELYSVIAVVLVVEKQSGEIISADCTLATELTRSFVKELLTGCNLNDIEAVESKLKTRYYGSARKAIISAVRNCSEKYRLICDNEEAYID